MSMKTSLICQNDLVRRLNNIIKDPPHIFISGPYGCGKTTIIHEFLEAYYSTNGISPHDPEWVLYLSSEQDRGIHCIRQSVAEFVRHSSAREGVYRFIVVDDADSLPMISQQALRRPMETHFHTTRFIFVSRHINDLIKPLKSRCLHLDISVVSPTVLISHFCKERGIDGVSLEPSAISMCMSIAQTPTELRRICNIICYISEEVRESKVITSDILLSLFAAPSFSLCLELLKAYIKGNTRELQRLFIEIWSTGISYEDFLHELTSSVPHLGMISPSTNQNIYQLILKGWIMFAQGKTHTFDLMRLFFTGNSRQLST
jgi:DNA polymerase III delta prime subunit